MFLLTKKIESEMNIIFQRSMTCRLFLLDKKDRVVAIGNPINQEKILSLYIGYVTKKRMFEKVG